MKFKIIWIDDSKDWIRSIQEEIEGIFYSYKFVPEIKLHQEPESASKLILSTYTDLILVDYNFSEDMKGDLFIKQLREQRCFAHVVFYSQELANLKVLEEDKHFLDVTHRSNILTMLERVADQAYRKYKHPAFMRGLLLSEFIDLENLMEDLIVQCFKGEGKYFRESIIEKGGESFSLERKKKFITRLITDAKQANNPIKSKLDKISFTGNQFNKKIVERRNVLAHAHLKYNDSGKITLPLPSDSPDVDFNEDWFCETREYIHSFKNKIRDLHDLNLYTIVNPASKKGSFPEC